MAIIERFLIWATSGWLALAVFVIALAAFHIRLVWQSPLDKAGWKRVDYYWLAFGALGLVGASTQAREIGVNAYVAVVDGFYQGLDPIRQSAATSQIAFCEPQQGRGTESQDEKVAYDAWCKWFASVYDRVANVGPGGRIDDSILANQPLLVVHGATSAANHLQEAVRTHNQWAQRRTEIFGVTEKSIGEGLLGLASPILLAIALALRITKVTGELRLK